MRKTSFHFHFSFLINLYKESLFCDEVYFVGAAPKIKTFDTFYCCERLLSGQHPELARTWKIRLKVKRLTDYNQR